MAPVDQPYTRRDLGDGLILRSATTNDAEALAEFNALVFGRPPDPPDLQAAAWTRDLLKGDHPTSSLSNHTIVELAATGQIVSSCLLISQTWTFDGIPIGVGRPELVGTHPDYRGRGLIGKQFETIHDRSRALDHAMQGLTGIPYYYRKFGYEPALVLPPPTILPITVPNDSQTGSTGSLRLRPATVKDLALIVELVGFEGRRSLISVERDADMWTYELFDRNPTSDFWHAMRVIETDSGVEVGIVAMLGKIMDDRAYVTMLELRDPENWSSLAPKARELIQMAAVDLAKRLGESISSMGFVFTPDHPFLRQLSPESIAHSRPFYWDVRVPDIPVFLERIAPALDRRLEESEMMGFSGDLSISFYERGVRMTFDEGHLVAVKPWLPEPVWRTEIHFPERSFLYLLFGSRSIEGIEYAVPDARVRSDTGRALINALFPRRASTFWPIS